MTETDLIRFVDAQAQVYSQVVAELTDGHKRTHWMWFIFPQLSSLGHSAMAQRYTIRAAGCVVGRREAKKHERERIQERKSREFQNGEENL